MSDLKSGTNEDDLTMKLTEIIFLNDVIKKVSQPSCSETVAFKKICLELNIAREFTAYSLVLHFCVVGHFIER